MDEFTLDQTDPNNEVTQTKDTLEKYLKRGDSLRLKAQKHEGRSLDWLEVAQWIHANLRPVIAKSSWRQYRASVIASVTQWADHQSEENPFELESAFAMVQEVSQLLHEGEAGTELDKNVRRTSSMKQKNLPPKDMEKIEAYSAKTKSKEYLGLTYFLWASILTGLRPSEWFTAEIIETFSGKNLIVKNGKFSNGRAHGERRTISLNHLAPEEVRYVETNLKLLSKTNTQTEDNFNEMLGLYRRRLNYLSRKLWPKRKLRPTLYSGRHQFSADCKARGCTLVEIAALMGHASDETASEHYGKKVSGTDGPRPQANPEEMAKVRNKMRLHNPELLNQ